SLDSTVRLWDLTRQPATVMDGASRVALFSPDGKFLAAGSEDGVVRLWAVREGGLISSQRLEGHSGAILSLAFSPDNKLLASGSRDNTLRLWALGDTSASLLGVLPGSAPVTQIAFSADGRFVAASGSNDGAIRLWERSSVESGGSPRLLEGLGSKADNT